ncbi:flavin-dependent oxidoreductase [Streptomyces sp. TRM66268-LWL]|uniref:Flavin-dependent oxidoreductase n=1 Tax=Streptomyces polyasparticus TaxID=2767826 RepID=A0ABR7SF14_9ACTN|nr:flavin-dependent oxidoreductase [Streptomyces polyasparticus]MBC9713564.1 flavin-dependent oxidoreductase [Streptomyces polyasparticus]
MTRVLVAGAGIGGLTAALSLRAAGLDVTLVDAARSLRPVGVGINLLPHAVRELTELGLGTVLAETGIPTAEMVHFDRHGNRIWGEPRGRALGYHWPQYSLHRGDLQRLLLDAVLARIGELRTDAAVTGFHDDGDRVRVRFAGGGSLDADVLVGADGLHSAVRAQLHPGEGPPLWNGIRMWRGLTETAPFLDGRTLAVAGSNETAKFVAYPVSRSAEIRGRALVNWVAEVRLAGRTPSADWDRTGRLADVLPHFGDWHLGWLDVPALLEGTGRILEYPMVDRDPLPWWGRGRVTLLGDAAHPMYPIGSNGASQAVLDARALARHLATTPGPEQALKAYEAERRPVTNALVLAHRDMPADRILAEVARRAPDGFARVEDVLTADELAAFDTAYRRTTGADVAYLNNRESWSVRADGA